MEEEKENFFRLETAIAEARNSLLNLLEFELTNRGITFHKFIEINGHKIYHLCYRQRCCQCSYGTKQKSETTRQKLTELCTFFDTGGKKLPGHDPGSKSAPDCCSPVNPRLELQDLDFTLAGLLLVEFTDLVTKEHPGERFALKTLVKSRNKIIRTSTKSGSIPNSKYEKCMGEIEESLLVLARIYGKEAEIKLKCNEIRRIPHDAQLSEQLRDTQQSQTQRVINEHHEQKSTPELPVSANSSQRSEENRNNDIIVTEPDREQNEEENFYYHSAVIVDVTKDVLLGLLNFYLMNEVITLQRFIDINGHGIYHLCYNRFSCCQCTPDAVPYTRAMGNLQPDQLIICLDPMAEKKPGHKDSSRSAPHCCCPVNSKLQLQDLDFTLARLLLVNFTTLAPPESAVRAAIDILDKSRNQSFVYARVGRISNDEYKKSILEIETSLLVLAKGYGHESEIKQRLYQSIRQPLTTIMCLHLRNTLLLQCQKEQNVRRFLADKKVPDCLSKDLCNVTVAEGCDAHFEIWTKEDDVRIDWFKNDLNIVSSDRIKTGGQGKIHSMDILDTCLDDKGLYTVRVNNIEREAWLDIKEYFTRNLKICVNCIEGDSIDLSCEVIEADVPAQWEKDGVLLQESSKYQMKDHRKTHMLTVLQASLHDTGNYSVNINNRVRTTSLQVQEYFANNWKENINCIEGDSVDLSCEVLETNVPAQWQKDGVVLLESSKYQMTDLGKTHMLTVLQASLNDTGNYSVKIKNRVRTTSLQVQEYFTSNLKENVECFQGENVDLSCDVIEADVPAQWEKDGVVLQESSKYHMKDLGNTHILTILQASLHDAGNYSVKINNSVRTTSLRVQEIPIPIRYLSEKDRNLYLEIIKSGTETRYCIKIVIIGEKGVGKTCLLRRLLGQNIDGVESTDGVEIAPSCKIRLSDGKWIFDKETDQRRDIMHRIIHAINERINSPQHQSDGLESPERIDNYSETKDTKLEMIKTCTEINIEQGLVPVNKLMIQGPYEEKEVGQDLLDHNVSKVLTKSVLQEISNFLTDLEKYPIPDEVLVDCRFLDFAGQKYYYPTHRVFLNPHAVHLLVADITKDIKQINTEDGYDKIGEYIDFWFDGVHACQSGKSKQEEANLNPPVILVCTGIDKCSGKLEVSKNVFRKQLLTLLHNEEKKKHLRHVCYVSNKDSSDKDFDLLRQSIFEFGKEMKTFGERIPLRWGHLEYVIDVIREAGVNIFSWSDITELGSKCSVDDENEINLFLKYLHNVGSIIYFEELKEHIIVNPKWLADAFKCLISVRFDSVIKLSPEWQELVNTGKLEHNLIEKLFQKEPQLELSKHKDHLINVMEMFGIIVKLNNPLNGRHGLDLSTYYMPCMISERASIAQVKDLFDVQNSRCICTPWLCIEFDFMPFDFFNHILCYYISQYCVCTEKLTNQKAIYNGVGVFFLDSTKFQKFIVCFSKNTVALQIWQWKTIDQSKCKEMLKELRSVIQRVTVKYGMSHVSYIVKAKCSNGNINFPAGRLTYEDLVDGEYFCEDHSDIHETKDFLQTWFQESQKVEDQNFEESETNQIQEVNNNHEQMIELNTCHEQKMEEAEILKTETDYQQRTEEIVKMKDTVPWNMRGAELIEEEEKSRIERTVLPHVCQGKEPVFKSTSEHIYSINVAIQGMNTSVQRNNTLLQGMNTSVQRNSTLFHEMNTLMQSKNTLLHGMNTSVKSNNTLLHRMNTSLQSNDTLLHLMNTSLQSSKTLLSGKNPFMQRNGTFLLQMNTSEQSKNTLLHPMNTSMQSNNTLLHGNKTSVQSNYALLHRMKLSMQSKNNLLSGINASVKSTNTLLHGINTEVKSNNTLLHGVNTSVQSNNTLLHHVHGMKTSVQSNTILIHGNNTSVQKNNTLLSQINTSVQSNNTLLHRINTSVQSNNSLLHRMNTSLQSNSTLLLRNNTSVQSNNTLLHRMNTSVQSNSTALPLGINTSVQSNNTLLHEMHTSVQSNNTLLHEMNTSVQSNNTLLHEMNTSVQSNNTLLHEMNTSVQSNNTLLHPMDISVNNILPNGMNFSMQSNNINSVEHYGAMLQKLLSHDTNTDTEDQQLHEEAVQKLGLPNVHLHHQFDLRSVLNGEWIEGASSGVMMDDGRLVLILHDMKRLLICNTDGSQTDSIPLQYKPRNVTAVNNSTVAVTSFDTCDIEIYDINNKLILEILPGGVVP